MKESFSNRKDWGECEGCQNKGMLLTPFVHHPTGKIAWLCDACSKATEEALQQGQVPGILDAKIKEDVWSPLNS